MDSSSAVFNRWLQELHEEALCCFFRASCIADRLRHELHGRRRNVLEDHAEMGALEEDRPSIHRLWDAYQARPVNVGSTF